MRISLFLFFGLTLLSGMATAQNRNLIKKNDSTLSALPVNVISTPVHPVVNNINADGNKVIISDADNSIEFSPMNSFNNGVLIQPINRVTNTGVPTSFYLHDTSSWSFYTNGLERLKIGGNNDITSSVPLLIQTTENNSNDALRVNGNVRIDSIFSLRADSDTLSYISFHRSIKSAYLGEDDGFSPYTSTPTTWAADRHIPVFRIRHPNNVAQASHPNKSIQRDFKILPYQYGMAIEFNGVVECWVGEWSVHRGDFYNDVEGKGNGWGAVSWVGDDQDGGGVRMTARNNLFRGGNVNYGELSVEKFGGGPNGDFRFRLPSSQNQFQFVYGERGSENIIAQLTTEGLVLPQLSSVAAAQSPVRAQVVFDSTESKFKGYNGSDWVNLANDDEVTGTFILSGNGTDATFLIPHGLGALPSYFNVIATSQDAGSFSYVTADSTFLIVHYTSTPIPGIDNLSWNWRAKR